MAHRDDVCICGHKRVMHNNRIVGNFHYEMRYNCCMDWDLNKKSICGCQKFKLKKTAKEIKNGN